MAFPAELLPRPTGPDRFAEPPPELAPHEVDWSRYSANHLQELESVLAQACDEKPFQTFLADHPHVLILGILGQKRQAWTLDRPNFAGKYIPDFLIGMRDSLGPTWMLVELESPTMEILRQDGEPRHELNHAVQQIRDYRRWLRANHDFFRKESGCWGIEAGCTGTVVIGRREMRADRLGAERVRDFRNENIDVMSYDRLVERYRGQCEWINDQARGIAELASQVERHGQISLRSDQA